MFTKCHLMYRLFFSWKKIHLSMFIDKVHWFWKGFVIAYPSASLKNDNRFPVSRFFFEQSGYCFLLVYTSSVPKTFRNHFYGHTDFFFFIRVKSKLYTISLLKPYINILTLYIYIYIIDYIYIYTYHSYSVCIVIYYILYIYIYSIYSI